MASAAYPVNQRELTEVRIRLHADGTALVQTGTQDIGTGTYTVIAQAVAEELGLEPDQVTVMLGDTDYRAPATRPEQSPRPRLARQFSSPLAACGTASSNWQSAIHSRRFSARNPDDITLVGGQIACLARDRCRPRGQTCSPAACSTRSTASANGTQPRGSD